MRKLFQLFKHENSLRIDSEEVYFLFTQPNQQKIVLHEKIIVKEISNEEE